jgi:hypothetical protein
MDEWTRSMERARERVLLASPAPGQAPDHQSEHRGPIRPVVYESWRRSKLYGLDPFRVAPTEQCDLETDAGPDRLASQPHLAGGLRPAGAGRGPLRVRGCGHAARRPGCPGRPLARLEQAEARAIMTAVREAGGNKHRAAESLGIARSTLYRKVRALGIDLSTSMY